jgi:hypothetical protein
MTNSLHREEENIVAVRARPVRSALPYSSEGLSPTDSLNR